MEHESVSLLARTHKFHQEKGKQMSSTKEELMNQILPLLLLATPAEQSKMRVELQARTLAELKAFLGVVSSSDYQAELAEEEILRVQAERVADRILFQIQHQKATEPERRAKAAAQLAQGKEVFAAVCRKHVVANIEANFSLLRKVVGDDFTEYSAAQAITSGAVKLAKADQSELDQWNAEALEQRNEFLLNADTETLRTLAREEHAIKRQAAVQTDADLQLAASKVRDAIIGFPLLPDTWNGQKLDSEFIRHCSAETQKLLQKRFGSAQLTARLQGRG